MYLLLYSYIVVRLCKVGVATRWVLLSGGCCYQVGPAARWVLLQVQRKDSLLIILISIY